MKGSRARVLLTLVGLLDLLLRLASQEVCGTAEKADILFLVDESLSVRGDHLQFIRDFISNVIRSLGNRVVGKAGVRLGVMFSGDEPRMSIELTDDVSMEELLVTVQGLNFKEIKATTGNTFTFAANMILSAGTLREDAIKVFILITDRQLSESEEEPAAALKDQGVTIFAVGIKNADRKLLKKIASEPFEEHVLYAEDFHHLGSLLKKLSRRICFATSESPSQPVTHRVQAEKTIGPRDLIISEQQYNSLRLHWTPSKGEVTGYQVLLDPLVDLEQVAPVEQRKITLDANQTSVWVMDLKPNTKYILSVLAIYGDIFGEPVTIKGKTALLPPVTNFRVIEERLFSLKVAWTPPLGKLKGYKIYIPKATRPGKSIEKNLSSELSLYVLENLKEDTNYTINIYAIYAEGPSKAISATGQTLKLSPVGSILLQNETTNTIQVQWTQVRGATGYRLTWASSDDKDRDVEESESMSEEEEEETELQE